MNEKSIVVGVDGSPGSRAALEFAMEEAVRRDARLRVVAAVALPDFWAGSYPAYVPPPPADMVGEVRKETRLWVDEVVTGRGAAARDLQVDVETRAGRPGEILVEAADGAELLVVGHRGRGSVASVLLGSVGLYCVLHARCPVTIVRPGPRTAPAAAPAAATAATAAAPA
jgi:nucleotide-binding universal stress UspA family protein